MVQFFKVTESLKDEVCVNFISFVRFITFDGEATHLYFARNEKINEIKRKREANRKTMDSDSDSDDNLDLVDVFRGHNVKYFNHESETVMWDEIKRMAAEQYAAFKDTLEYDTELLMKDDAETNPDKKLTYNQRNCVLYRQGEKEILVFWMEMAEQMCKWMAMDVKQVQTELKHSKRYDRIDEYVNHTLIPMMKGQNPYGLKQ